MELSELSNLKKIKTSESLINSSFQTIILNEFNESKTAYLPIINDNDYDKVYSTKDPKVVNYQLPYEYNTKLFCYGTIQDNQVRLNQLNNNNHKMIKAVLIGYEVKKDMLIEGVLYPCIRKNPKSIVLGHIIEFSLNELELLDIYETNNYKRIELIDQNGFKSWVYCENELK